MPNLDSEPDFDGFVSEDFGENKHFAATLNSDSDLDVNSESSEQTPLLWRCP